MIFFHHLIQKQLYTILYSGTTHFLNKLHELPPLTSGSLLVILDVCLLYYTNIPHDEGIRACEEALDSRIDQSLPTKDICHLIKLILTTNAFTFNDAFYLQQSGTAMGTRMAPSYTNLFMGKFECEFLLTQTALPLVWWRFIDDVFAIWTRVLARICIPSGSWAW